VGVPAPDVEVKVADDGEVMYRGPGVFQGYHKNEDETRKTKTADGWVKTGDAGIFDARGHLKIIDRARDVGRLQDGGMFAPKYLENKLKFFPHIKEAVTFGDARDYVAAFINIDLDAVGNWAERNAIAFASYQELAAHAQVYGMIARHIEQVNRDLAADERLRNSQIKRFLILHKELDPDDGELTRTRKVRRATIVDKYAKLINALYSDATHCHIRTEVTFEDGRSGAIEADLEIRDVEIYTSPTETRRKSVMKPNDAKRMLSPRYPREIISFANINITEPVWWLDISCKKLQENAHEFLVFALCGEKEQLEILKVPTAFLRENLSNLDGRDDKDVLSLELSCEGHNLFECVRPVSCGVSFAKFHVDTLNIP